MNTPNANINYYHAVFTRTSDKVAALRYADALDACLQRSLMRFAAKARKSQAWFNARIEQLLAEPMQIRSQA